MAETLHVLNEEQKKLIEDNLDFCYYWFNLHGIYSEDKQQTLLLYLCRYIYLYDSERGTITTFIGTILESKFKYLYTEANRAKRKANDVAISLDEPIYTDDGKTYTLGDIAGYLENGFNAVEAKMIVNNIIKNIKADATLTEKRVKMFLTYVETRNYSFCGKLYGVSKQAAEYTIKHIFKVIRQHHLDWDNLDAHYQKYTLPEMKHRFWELNKAEQPVEKAVVIIAQHAMRNKTRENRTFVITSDHPYFHTTCTADKLGATKLKDKSGKRYLLSKWIKDEIKDVEACYLL